MKQPTNHQTDTVQTQRGTVTYVRDCELEALLGANADIKAAPCSIFQSANVEVGGASKVNICIFQVPTPYEWGMTHVHHVPLAFICVSLCLINICSS